MEDQGGEGLELEAGTAGSFETEVEADVGQH